MLDNIYKWFKRVDLSIDLGTANTLIYAKGKGIILNEPSVITVQNYGSNDMNVIAVGRSAKQMVGRTSGNIQSIRPLRDGVVADFKLAETMIRYFIKKVKPGVLKSANVVVCVPTGATPVERRAIQEAVYNAGSSKVYLIEEPVAAALGCKLPIMDPVGSMIVDIGGGTTEVAVLSTGGVVYSRSSRVGGDKMDDDIMNYIKKKFKLLIGEATAQSIKEAIGSAKIISKEEEENSVRIKGTDIVTGLPQEITITAEDVKLALEPSIALIVDICKEALENTPPELASDIIERGIMIAGGGSLLTNLDIVIAEEIGLSVFLAPQPLESIALGTGTALENITLFQCLLDN